MLEMAECSRRVAAAGTARGEPRGSRSPRSWRDGVGPVTRRRARLDTTDLRVQKHIIQIGNQRRRIGSKASAGGSPAAERLRRSRVRSRGRKGGVAAARAAAGASGEAPRHGRLHNVMRAAKRAPVAASQMVVRSFVLATVFACVETRASIETPSEFRPPTPARLPSR
ncbi:hypothetical protein M885DRAFT_548519 [Pelagophyceae sp. CCMP2097]|nr:hypothetical protein M885DRAFT_548519 [Pelagophyceae sp. CCMP2097]